MGSGCITAIMTLFFEYTVEISYPVPEAMVGGLLTMGNNLVGWYIQEYFSDWMIMVKIGAHFKKN